MPLPAPTTLILAASLLGGALLYRHLRRRRVAAAWGAVHGGLAVLAVGWGVVSAWGAGFAPPVNAGLLCLAAATIGGGFVALFRLQGEPPPLIMVWLHAMAAVVGLGLLLSA